MGIESRTWGTVSKQPTSGSGLLPRRIYCITGASTVLPYSLLDESHSCVAFDDEPSSQHRSVAVTSSRRVPIGSP